MQAEVQARRYCRQQAGLEAALALVMADVHSSAEASLSAF